MKPVAAGPRWPVDCCASTVATRSVARADAVPWTVAGVLGLALLATSALALSDSFATPRPFPNRCNSRFRHPTDTQFGGPPGAGTGTAAQLALSADGRHARLRGAAHSHRARSACGYGRSGRSPRAQMPGTDDASFPFWSPDGRFIGFFAGGKLKKVQASAGAAGRLVRRAERPRRHVER